MTPEVHPHHAHPFSLQEAMQFEPGTITSEIARLQNSLQHLAGTQSLLEEHIATDPDPDLIQALEENRVVIASQTERIGILRQALDKQGIVLASNAHYELLSSIPVVAPQTQTPPTLNSTRQPANEPPQSGVDENGGHGVYL